MAAAPHSSQIHAMALSLDGQTLLTGGSDGYVRKYDVNATMNGKTMLTQNVRHGFVEGITRGGTLTAFWANEEHPPTNGASSSSSSTSYHHSSIPEKDRLVGVIHSLAIQQDALWSLSGSESGNIHLTTIRHDPGSTRHVFRKHKGPVSALTLTSDETTMISGGWDRGVHQWDLNTGQVVRSFNGFAGQISGLSFRPISQQREEGRMGVSIHASAAEGQDVEALEDEEDKARNEGTAATGDGDGMDAKQAVGEEAKKDGEEASKSISVDETGQQKEGDVKQAETSATSAASSEPHKAAADKPEQNGTQSSSSDKPSADSSDSTQANGSTPAADSTNTTNASNGITSNTVSTSESKDKTPVPASTTDKPTTPPPSAAEVKKESDPTAPSSGAPGDDPTEEELAFEAELNASLGMSLDGSGVTKADGTRPDSVTAGASGTTAGGLMVAGADQDGEGDGDLFGGDTPPPSSAAVKKEDGGAVKKEDNGSGGVKGDDSDGDDSLFGGDDEDADGDADMEGEADADGDADGDGDGEEDEDGEDDGSSDEDMPLAGRAMVKNPSSNSLLGANGTPAGTASPSLSIALPSATATPTAVAAAVGKDTKTAAAPSTAAAAPSTADPPKKALPKPAFGGFSIASSFDAPLSTFSPDVMLSTSLSGQVILWDLRCPNYTPSDGVAKGVHSLPLPAKVPPWCQSAIFNSTGDKVFVGRRNESADEWDLRMATSAKFVRSLQLPSGSGPVYSLAAMPNARHIVCGSYDNIRLWDTEFVPGPAAGGELKVPFKIVAGHHGASLSSVLVDASCKFLISASGDRGWMGTSTEAVIIHDIKALT